MSREAIIERTKPYRFTKGNNKGALAPKCRYCGRTALKRQPWCKRHQPGHARDRRQQSVGQASIDRARVILREAGAERLLGDLAYWPPVARILAHRPRHTRPVPIADVVQALLAMVACGDAEQWAGVVARMRDAGLILPGDPPLVSVSAPVVSDDSFKLAA